MKKKSLHILSRELLDVSYFVDNVWEWLRTNEPSRRISAFAYSTLQQAEIEARKDDRKVYKIGLPEEWSVAQIVVGVGREDAKNHVDNRLLREIIIRELGGKWLDKSYSERGAIGAAFLPCIAKDELDKIFSEYNEIGEKLRSISTFWKDVRVTSLREIANNIGECFFEVPKDGYRIRIVGS
jgi:hypothetical protein